MQKTWLEYKHKAQQLLQLLRADGQSARTTKVAHELVGHRVTPQDLRRWGHNNVDANTVANELITRERRISRKTLGDYRRFGGSPKQSRRRGDISPSISPSYRQRSTMISITTDSVLPRERAEFWADLVSRHVTPMRIELAGAQPLRGEINTRMLGELGVAHVSGVGVRALHTAAQVARARSHLYAACVHVEGEARISRRGEQIALRRGDVFITDSRHEFTLDLERPWRHLLITLPTHWLDGRVARPEVISGAVLRDHPLVRLWTSHVANGFALAGALSSTAATLFARHSVDLLAQLFEELHLEYPTPSDAWRAAVFLGACQVIALKFGDPNLTPGRIATRTLAWVFAAKNETIMRRLFVERAHQAAKSLTAPESAHRSVTEIALACGFNDVSNFGRVFAAKMHMTPSEWRRRGRAQAATPDA